MTDYAAPTAVNGSRGASGDGIGECDCGCGTLISTIHGRRYVDQAHRLQAWAQRQAAQAARQRALPLDPPPAPLPPVIDQRVPEAERPKLRRMARLILERVERGPATASELHAMFPGARSVRTRISEVGRFVGPAWHSAPVKGVVGEWLYWVEGVS